MNERHYTVRIIVTDPMEGNEVGDCTELTTTDSRAKLIKDIIKYIGLKEVSR